MKIIVANVTNPKAPSTVNAKTRVITAFETAQNTHMLNPNTNRSIALSLILIFV